MNIGRGLVLKVSGGVAVAGTATTLGVIYGKPKSEEKKEEKRVVVPPAPPKKPTLREKVANLKNEKAFGGIQFTDSKENINSSAAMNTEDLRKLIFGDLRNGDMKSESEIRGIMKFEIEKTNDIDVFPEEVRVYMVNTSNDIVVTRKEDNYEAKLTFKKGTNPEFRVLEGRLVPAWNIDNLAKRVGLVCDKEKRTCSLAEGKTIDVMEEDIKNKPNTKGSVKVTFEGSLNYESNQENHFQGFKFTVSNDIVLKKSNEEELKVPRLLKEDNGKAVSYQIKIADDEEKGWNLIRSL